MRHHFRLARFAATVLTIEGDQIAFTDLDGDYACKGGDSPEGMYRVKMDGDMLTFTTVRDDECPGRVATMTPTLFTIVK